MDQCLLFENYNKKYQNINKSIRINKGAKDAESRYSALKMELDNDYLFNGNWEEVDTQNINLNSNRYNYVDLFSGAGGISVGFHQAGLTKILSIEINHEASNTIRNNFKNSNHIEKPIEQIDSKMLNELSNNKDIHIICGGPPCQGFSVAGLRNLNDPRNQLFKEYIRIVKYLKPYFVFLENVPGILTMKNGEIYKEIIQHFAEIGYPNMSVRILEAANFGVPQLRTRAIFIGNRLNIKNPYPKIITTKNNYKSIKSAIDDLKNIPFDSKWNHEGTKHSDKMIKRISSVSQGDSLYKTFRDAWKRQYKNVPSMTIKENHGGVHIHYELNRVLTAREMARLQTFPDDYIFSGTFKKVYWQIGNAVPCLLAKHIGLAIKYSLIKNKIE